MKKIGIFSTFAELAALDLTQTTLDFVEQRYKGVAEISFVFSNRDFGEKDATDRILQRLLERDIRLIIFSAADFKKETRIEAKKREKNGDLEPISKWRNDFGEKVLAVLPQTDFDLLLGDYLIWGENMCQERNGINLHPALPDGPKGEWHNVIWELIQKRALESGVMMHKVTKNLDRGPAVTFCRYSLRDPEFDHLWQMLPKDQNELRDLIERQKCKRELADYPLHAKIREHGLTREFPLVLQTAAALIEGRISIEGNKILDRDGNELDSGLNLTKEIDNIVRPQLEGDVYAFSRKEVR